MEGNEATFQDRMQDVLQQMIQSYKGRGAAQQMTHQVGTGTALSPAGPGGQMPPMWKLQGQQQQQQQQQPMQPDPYLAGNMPTAAMRARRAAKLALQGGY